MLLIQREVKVFCSFLIIVGLAIFLHSIAYAAPPIFDPIGEERELNSNLYVVEGNLIEFTVSAKDPNGDALIFSAENVPLWAGFDELTGVFSGITPLWSSEFEIRKEQQGIFDVTFNVTDGTYTVSKIVTINVLDSKWIPQTMEELVGNRPITAGGNIGTPVALDNVVDETIWTNFGGGKFIRKITFGFTSQVPDIPGREQDWASTTNYAYLPDTPSVYNMGAVVEGLYLDDWWGDLEFGQRVCAELNIPVVIINKNPSFPGQFEYLLPYFDKAIETRDPRYLWFVFSSAHFLRATDALITIIDQYTNWPFSFADFKFVVTGHSKFGAASWTTAAANPQRAAGLMSSGYEPQDHDAYRLLARLQGAVWIMPDAWNNYVGLMMKYYTEPLGNLNEMNPQTHAMLSGGTNDMKGVANFVMPKYLVNVSEKQLTIPHRVGHVPNLGHSNFSDRHSTYWRMLIAHCFLGRNLSNIDMVRHYPDGGNITVEATISGTPFIQEVRMWATNQTDTDVSYWDNFVSYPMSFNGNKYEGQIPGDSTAYYVEVLDMVDGIDGIISSSPTPVNRNYPLLQLPPGDAENFQATWDSQNGNIDLAWTNPVDEDFAGITICYRTNDYPASPMDGMQIYDGIDTTFSHTNVVEDTTYYYTAFTYDSMGNYDNGVTATSSGTTPVNDPPILAPIGDKTVDEEQLLEFTIYAMDPNGDILTFSVVSLPPGATFTDNGDNTATFTWTPTYEQAGTYQVTFTVSDGDLEDSETITIAVKESIPNAPSNLQASAISSSQINLSWTDNSNNETGFKIERKIGVNGTYTQIATVGANATSYSDTGLTADTTYYYRLRAYNTSGDSSYSNEAYATTQAAATVPIAPSNLQASAISGTSIKLAWTDNSNNETGFKIERKIRRTYTQIATVGANVTSYTDNSLKGKTTYYYRVKAYNSAGDSNYSNVASAKTLRR